MALARRRVSPLMILALLAVAALGYLAGHRRVSSAPEASDFGGKTRLLSNAGLLLEYPLGWEKATAPVALPGLPISDAVALHPSGRTVPGLLSGLLPANEPTPLPASFLALLAHPPRTEVVSLITTQAFRYTEMQLPGYPYAFDLYVIPNSGAGPRVIACYAPTPLPGNDRECEQIVQQVTLIGPSASSLTPDPSYAGRLSSIVTVLDAVRTSARRQMSASPLPATVGSLAEPVAKGFAAAASSLATLEPPQVAAAAQGGLAHALREGTTAYEALAAAARAENLGEYDTARGLVSRDEKAIDAALRNFALLGYGRS